MRRDAQYQIRDGRRSNFDACWPCPKVRIVTRSHKTCSPSDCSVIGCMIYARAMLQISDTHASGLISCRTMGDDGPYCRCICSGVSNQNHGTCWQVSAAGEASAVGTGRAPSPEGEGKKAIKHSIPCHALLTSCRSSLASSAWSSEGC